MTCDRRDFLRDALFGAGALMLPIRFVSAIASHGTEKLYPLPTADGANIDKGESVVIARYQNVVYAFSLACPHQQTALRWQETDKEFQCPKHHSHFHADGVYIEGSGRATRGMDRFAIRRADSNVAVDLDKLFRQDEDEAAWKAAAVQL